MLIGGKPIRTPSITLNQEEKLIQKGRYSGNLLQMVTTSKFEQYFFEQNETNLMCYVNKNSKPQIINIEYSVLKILDLNKFKFQLITQTMIFTFIAPSFNEMQFWIKSIHLFSKVDNENSEIFSAEMLIENRTHEKNTQNNLFIKPTC